MPCAEPAGPWALSLATVQAPGSLRPCPSPPQCTEDSVWDPCGHGLVRSWEPGCVAVNKGLVASVNLKKVGSAWWLSWALDPWFWIRS